MQLGIQYMADLYLATAASVWQCSVQIKLYSCKSVTLSQCDLMTECEREIL